MKFQCNTIFPLSPTNSLYIFM